MIDKKKLSWNDVTLFQFNKLQELLKMEDETERIIAISELLYGEDVTDLTLGEFRKRIDGLAFLKEEIPTSIPPKSIEIKGRKYQVKSLLGDIKTAQYLDYVNHLKTGKYNMLLSVFIVPEGHEYNDGYDLMQVFEDVDNIPITVALSIAFFFSRQFLKFTQIFQSYSAKRVKKMKLPKKEEEQLLKAIQTLQVLESYHIY